MFASAHFNVANMLRAASKFVRLLCMHFWFPEHATIFESLELKSCFRMSNIDQSGYVNCTLLSLHNVTSLCFLSKCCRCNVCFRTTLHCMDERCAGVMPQFRSAEQAEVGFDD